MVGSLGNNQIRDVSPLAKLTNLEYLWLKGNQIQNTAVLANLPNLRQVDFNIPPIISVRRDDGSSDLPSVGQTLRYRVVIQNAWNVIGFNLSYIIPHKLVSVKSVGWFDNIEHTSRNKNRSGSLTASGLPTRRSLHNVAIFTFNATGAGEGHLEVGGKVTTTHGTVNLNTRFPLTIFPSDAPGPAEGFPTIDPTPQPGGTGIVPDPNLAAAVRKALNIGANARITKQVMGKLTEIRAREKNIRNLTGLEHATQLRTLSLADNQISDLRPLAKLTQLRGISLFRNQISDLRPLAKLTQLTWLDIGGNQIRNITPLGSLAQLDWLSLWGNRISNLRSLVGLTRLSKLDLWNNQISDLRPLAKLTQLKELGLHENKISDVTPLAGLVNLEVLKLQGNPIQDTSPLGSLPKLREVDIKVSKPPPGSAVAIPDPNLAAAVRKALGLGPNVRITKQIMQRLTTLSASDRQIRNLTGLEYATELIILQLGKNRITNFSPLAQLSKLRKLFLWTTEISDLNVLPQLPKLEFLDLNWNRINDVSPLAGFKNLKELWLQGNNLTDTSTLFQLRGGTFPSDEEVVVTEERDNSGRAYTLLIFRSLDLRVRIRSGITIFRRRNLVSSNVHVESPEHPPMYWVNTDNGTLHRLIGTEVENLVPGVRNATNLAIDVVNEKLYWTEQTSNTAGSIRRANLDGTNVQLVRNLTSVIHDIALDTAGGKIYLTNAWGKVKRLNVDGSNFEPNLIIGLDSPNGLALDVSADKVYWTEMSGRIRRANMDGSNIEDVATGLGTPMGLVVFDGTVYWTEKMGENRGEIRFVSSDRNSNILTRNTFTQGFPISIAVDAVERTLYWTTSLGEIGRQLLDGSSFQPNFVTGLSALGAFALHTETVYVEPTVVTPTDAVLSISPSSVVSPAIGEKLTLNLNIAAGEAVSGYQVTLQFDPTALRYVESRNGDYLPTGAFFVPPVVNRGSVELAATAFSEMSNGDGTLATVTFEVLTVKTSSLTLSDMLLADDQGNTFLPQVEAGEITEPPELKTDVTGDGVVNIQDLVLVASSFGQTGEISADVNGDGVVNIADLVLVAGSLGMSAGAPLLHPDSLELLTTADVRGWLSQAHQLNDINTDYQRGVLMLERLLVALIPKETILLPNYPNPFNPETWIPYQLSETAEVTLDIYAVNGTLIRTLALGQQSAGMYHSKSRAAYWDGQNEVGESVASGVYFYVLTAGDFSATRKMLILK